MHTFDPDDPRLTAYALGEMDEPERTAFEREIGGLPDAHAEIAAIRAAAQQLTAILEKEPALAVPMPDPALPEEKIEEPSLARRPAGAKLIRFPYYIFATLAAACFAFVVLLREEKKDVRESPKRDAAEQVARQQAAELAQAKVETGAVEFNNAPRTEENVAAMVMDANEDKAKVELQPIAPEAVPLNIPVLPAKPAGVPMAAGKQAQSRASDETEALSPFDASKDIGYFAREPRAGRRLDTNTGDLAASITIITKQQFEATNAANVNDIFLYESPGVPASSLRARALRANTEAYAYASENAFLKANDSPLSTFSLEVDTASYTNVRRFLQEGRLPPKDAVRIEELVNYFTYDYAAPAGVAEGGATSSRTASEARGDQPAAAKPAGDPAPLAITLEAGAAPWQPEHRLVRIGLKAREVSVADRPPANLVFLLDVSGSMEEPNKLPLVKAALRLLVAKLKPEDRVAIVTYAGNSGLALPSTPASRQREILEALDHLEAGGSTNGAMGIQLAYDIARANFARDGLNRVILCTDGDFNVGVTSPGDLIRLVQDKAKSGVMLTVLGFGMGNYKDATLEQLADKGNGNYGYVDSLGEARRLLVEQAGGTLMTVAKDVKLQVEFNPARVQSYRLIGYENRLLQKEDFNNDKVDAGEIGAGHTVTALYEVVPVGAANVAEAPPVDALKYQAAAKPAKIAANDELLTVKVRYKEPAAEVSRKLDFPLVDRGADFSATTADFKFAAAVAGFGMLLKDSPYKGTATWDQVKRWAEQGAARTDAGGYRGEFVTLIERARSIATGG